MPRLALRSTTALALVLSLPLIAAACANPPVDAPAWQATAGNQSAYESPAGSPAPAAPSAPLAAADSGKTTSASAAAPAAASAGAKAASGQAGSSSKPAAGGGGAGAGAGAASGGSAGKPAASSPTPSGSAGAGTAGSAADDPFGLGGLDPAMPSSGGTSGTRDANGPCKDLMLFCFDPFDMFTLNPECLTCNNGQGCMDCVNFQAI